MAIIVGDIHGNVEKVQAFLTYKPDELHIALGDYVDSFYEPPKRQFRALRLLLQSGAVLLWGNHDLHYCKIAPWFCTGRQYKEYTQSQFINLFTRYRSRFKAAYAVDGWLCSHAGVKRSLQQNLNNASDVTDLLNAEFAKWIKTPVCYQSPDGRVATKPESIFHIGGGRGGYAAGGVFWFDYKLENGLDGPIKQIFGHTETKDGPVPGSNYICLDTTNNLNFCWVYDTSAEEIVKLDLSRSTLVAHWRKRVPCWDLTR